MKDTSLQILDNLIDCVYEKEINLNKYKLNLSLLEKDLDLPKKDQLNKIEEIYNRIIELIQRCITEPDDKVLLFDEISRLRNLLNK